MKATFRTTDTPDGVEIVCDCGEVMRFTQHTTVGHMQAAKNDHAKTHAGQAVLVQLDPKARLYGVDETNIYLEFMKDGKIQLVVPALNEIAGRAGAWAWKFDGTADNAAHLERVFQRRCEREQERREQGRAVETVRVIPDDPTTEIEVEAPATV